MIQRGSAERSDTWFFIIHVSFLENIQNIFFLGNKDPKRRSFEFNFKEVMERTQILDGKKGTKLRNSLLAGLRVGTSDKNIIYLNQNKYQCR